MAQVYQYNVAAVILIVTIMVIYHVRPHYKSLQSKVFGYIQIFTLIISVSDLCGALCQNNAVAVPTYVHYICQSVFFVALIIDYVLYFYYICLATNFYNKITKMIGFIVTVCIVPISATNYVTNLLFHFGEKNEYIRGGFFIPYSAIGFSVLAFSLVLIVKYSVRVEIRLRIALILFVVGIVIAECIQITTPRILITNYVMTVFILALYYALQSPDDYEKLLQVTDQLQKSNLATEKAMLEAENANKAKTNFLANMSHEIRTPINGILGMNTMILKECDDPQIIEYAKNVESASRSLLAIINDILDISKIESGRMELVLGKYSLSSLISDCYHMVCERAKEKRLNFEVENDPTIPDKLYGDETRIRQIIVNILTNGIKYTPKGSVTLKLGWTPLPGNKLRLSIAVKDTGMGIAKENIEKLFDEFKRIDEKRNRNIEGTGLGLAIVKRMVDMMEGKISVESEVGVGSTFTVELEQEIVSSEAMGTINTSGPSKNAGNLTKKKRLRAPNARVLIVDDIEMNIKVTKGLLKETQIKVDTALSGSECLGLAAKNKYDIIFLDHMMPEMDGVETLKKLREMKNSPNADTPVVALTANAIQGAREYYLEIGFENYLYKPVDEGYLYAILQECMPSELIEYEKSDEQNEDEDMAQKSFIERVSFLDTEKGLGYCSGMEDFYEEIVGDFVNDNMLEVISESFEKRDWNSYHVRTHALKGIALTIGATEFSAFAKRMELASKEGRYDEVEKNQEEFMKQYAELIEKLRKALGE